jgi:4-carboxymuconolactone decarboxylase
VWSRETLDRRVRSCVTLGILTALGREDEIALHTEVAVRNGLTPEEIAEVLLHSAVYAGVPNARGAVLVAERVLDGLAASD